MTDPSHPLFGMTASIRTAHRPRRMGRLVADLISKSLKLLGSVQQVLQGLPPVPQGGAPRKSQLGVVRTVENDNEVATAAG